MRWLLVLICLWPCAIAAQETVTAGFDLRFGPLRVAEITLLAEETDTAYAAAGRVAAAGLAGAFRDIRFDLASEGLRTGAEFLPLFYREDVDTGRRISAVRLEYRDGQPVVLSLSPAPEPGPWTIAAQDQVGAVDPMSALYRMARPRPLDELCDWSVAVFDGVRQSSLSLGPAVQDGARSLCEGAYRRIAGFPPEDMAERSDFPFTAEFARLPDGRWRLTRVDAQTLYGRVRILSRP
jgi:hypothetical protein